MRNYKSLVVLIIVDLAGDTKVVVCWLVASLLWVHSNFRSPQYKGRKSSKENIVSLVALLLL